MIRRDLIISTKCRQKKQPWSNDINTHLRCLPTCIIPRIHHKTTATWCLNVLQSNFILKEDKEVPVCQDQFRSFKTLSTWTWEPMAKAWLLNNAALQSSWAKLANKKSLKLPTRNQTWLPEVFSTSCTSEVEWDQMLPRETRVLVLTTIQQAEWWAQVQAWVLTKQKKEVADHLALTPQRTTCWPATTVLIQRPSWRRTSSLTQSTTTEDHPCPNADTDTCRLIVNWQ